MADDCVALGFEMDCGNAFSERYGKAVSYYEELDKIIDDVKDIELLGSAIYAQCRHFNHWAYAGEETLKFKNCSWFILALGRLAMLTGKILLYLKEPLNSAEIYSLTVGLNSP